MLLQASFISVIFTPYNNHNSHFASGHQYIIPKFLFEPPQERGSLKLREEVDLNLLVSWHIPRDCNPRRPFHR